MPDGLELRYQFVGTAAATRILARAAASPERLHAPLTAIGAHLAAATQARFNRSQAPSGARWKPVKRKGKPLILTGRLLQSITSRVSGKTVAVGSPVPYSPYHQFGTSRIFARPYLGLDARDKSAIKSTISEYIATIVRGG